MTMDRSALNRIRGSIGMGQGNVRNQDTRSNDMAYAPQSGGFGWMGQGQNAGTQASPYGQKPGYGTKPAPNYGPQYSGGGAENAQDAANLQAQLSAQIAQVGQGFGQMTPNPMPPTSYYEQQMQQMLGQFGGSGMNAQPNGGGMTQGTQGFGPQRQPGMPSDYAQQYNRFAGAGGAPGAFQGRMGAQGPQYRPGTNLQGGTGVNPKPPGPGGGVTDPPEYGLPPADGYGGDYGADRSLQSYMARPAYVRPRFGVGP